MSRPSRVLTERLLELRPQEMSHQFIELWGDYLSWAVDHSSDAEKKHYQELLHNIAAIELENCLRFHSQGNSQPLTRYIQEQLSKREPQVLTMIKGELELFIQAKTLPHDVLLPALSYYKRVADLYHQDPKLTFAKIFNELLRFDPKLRCIELSKLYNLKQFEHCLSSAIPPTRMSQIIYDFFDHDDYSYSELGLSYIRQHQPQAVEEFFASLEGFIQSHADYTVQKRVELFLIVLGELNQPHALLAADNGILFRLYGHDRIQYLYQLVQHPRLVDQSVYHFIKTE